MAGPAYISEHFLLQTHWAEKLYHEYAAGMPIIDYHSHLQPEEIAGARRFENMTHLWIKGDHYKWRAMRANGIAEHFITGDASDWEKFECWAATVPRTLRNPLYHWTHLELAKPFGITDRLLSPETAGFVWQACNEQLSQPDFSALGLLKQWKVVLLYTTDDPTDALPHHDHIAADTAIDVRVLPTFRPDQGLAIEQPGPFNAWTDKLSQAAGLSITVWEDWLEALQRRCLYFHERGCRLADHSLEEPYADEYGMEIESIFRKARAGKLTTPEEARKFKSATLHALGRVYHKLDWTQQYHLGALRNPNTRMLKALGTDSGFDTMGDRPMGRALAKLLDRLDREGHLPRTILYNLNPRDSELFAAMAGSFQEGPQPGKIQYGSAWWFLDQKDGMERQLNALASMGLLSRFIGMLTDSRSFLSFSRHEYFRRILCNALGNDIEQGLLPQDLPLIGGMVQDICYNNARRYFRLEVNVPDEGKTVLGRGSVSSRDPGRKSSPLPTD